MLNIIINCRKNFIGNIGVGLAITTIATQSFAHEPWLMNNKKLQILKNKPPPDLFTSFNAINVNLICATIVIILLLHVLYYTKNNISRLSESSLKIKCNYVPTILRIFTAATLIIAAFGLIPQTGSPLFTPSLLVADIKINHLHYTWLKWSEILLAGGLLLGIYIRLQGMLLILITIIAFFLYPNHMFLYIGYFFGISIYLILEGPGKLTVSNNNFISSFSKKNLSNCLIQILTGITFIISGSYKAIHPNIDIELLVTHHSYTFSIPYDIFTLLMAIVEISAGIFIVTGAFLRIVAILLFIPFLYLSYILNENFFAHLFLYGILLSFILNGSYHLKVLFTSDNKFE